MLQLTGLRHQAQVPGVTGERVGRCLQRRQVLDECAPPQGPDGSTEEALPQRHVQVGALVHRFGDLQRPWSHLLRRTLEGGQTLEDDHVRLSATESSRLDLTMRRLSRAVTTAERPDHLVPERLPTEMPRPLPRPRSHRTSLGNNHGQAIQRAKVHRVATAVLVSHPPLVEGAADANGEFLLRRSFAEPFAPLNQRASGLELIEVRVPRGRGDHLARGHNSLFCSIRGSSAGQSWRVEPRASSARAMSGWWPWNPKAMRVSNRILVLVDSTSVLES